MTWLMLIGAGSDDARPPDFPAHVLGSRADGVNSLGVYGNRKSGPVKDIQPATSLSTIEEKSQAVSRKQLQATSFACLRKSKPCFYYLRFYEQHKFGGRLKD